MAYVRLHEQEEQRRLAQNNAMTNALAEAKQGGGLKAMKLIMAKIRNAAKSRTIHAIRQNMIDAKSNIANMQWEAQVASYRVLVLLGIDMLALCPICMMMWRVHPHSRCTIHSCDMFIQMRDMLCTYAAHAPSGGCFASPVVCCRHDDRDG